MAIVIKKIAATEVDFTEYDTFSAKCRGQINVSCLNALNLSIEAANTGAKLAEYKALLSYTLSELEQETKAVYGIAFLNANAVNPMATSDPKREAVARQNVQYIAKLDEMVKIKSLLEYVQDCLDYSTKLHYIFKGVYAAETKLPVNDYITR